MVPFLRASTFLAAAGVLVACGDEADEAPAPGAAGAGGSMSGSAGSGGSPSTGGSGSGELFPNAPECELGFVRVTGTLAGESYLGGSPPSNWSAREITFGIGQIEGGIFGNEYELDFAEKLSLGKRVAVTGGYLYVVGNHSLAEQYVCVQTGEIGLVQAPPGSETVLIEFELTAGALGRGCDGGAQEMSLNGCISRTSTYVP